MTTPRAIAVTREATYIDARSPLGAPPADILTIPGVVSFFERITGMFADDGVLLLDKYTADSLGLVGVGKNVPILDPLRAAGFGVKDLHRWFHVKHRGQTINVGLLEHIDAEYCPIIGAARMSDVTTALATWHRLAGRPWFGSAGDTGNELLRSVATMRHDGRTIVPQFWTYENKGPGPVAAEMAYQPGDWHRELSGCGKAYGYDRVRAYLAAMTTTPVAGFHLAHEDRVTTFNPKRSGWWRVKVAPWHLYHLMPDPAGYGPRLDDGSRWLTTPTLRLIADLERDGVHGGFEILESWTAPSQENILGPYAAKLRTMYDHAREIRDDTERDLIHASIKGAYRMQNGMWSSTQSDIKRPDWSAAVVAMSRATVWRAAWRAGWRDTTGPVGNWPLWVDTDAVFYPGPDDPTKVAEPYRFGIKDALGGWRPMPPRDVSRETGRPVSRRQKEVNA
jgi:hypothetical protein